MNATCRPQDTWDRAGEGRFQGSEAALRTGSSLGVRGGAWRGDCGSGNQPRGDQQPRSSWVENNMYVPRCAQDHSPLEGGCGWESWAPEMEPGQLSTWSPPRGPGVSDATVSRVWLDRVSFYTNQ